MRGPAASSTLGQKRRFDPQPATSGLPRTTDIVGPTRWSGSCQTRTSRIVQISCVKRIIRAAKVEWRGLLRRSIAHRIQEKAYGGLPSSTRRLLDQLVKAAMAKPNGRLELPRRIKPGSELVRTWKGKSYRVMVMADGFSYDGKRFASLSEIATEITGTKWNGPRFFGLRSASSNGEADGR